MPKAIRTILQDRGLGRSRVAADPRYQFLRQLTTLKLPHQVDDAELITHLVSLQAAGLVEADLPKRATSEPGDFWNGPAWIHRVTKTGLAALEEHRALRG